ncbi:MAG: HRDC domain-containing protein, partial [Oscillospiraceae bacterium]|nr:HRDC domain-containing protein [Oscillospiraceae bacterium]
RFSIASEQKVPAFVIFSDASLTDMCMKLPQNADEFLNISGVGRVKLERYGEQFIKLIAAFCAEKVDNASDEIVVVSQDFEPDELYNYVDEHKSEIEILNEPVTISAFTDKVNCLIAQKYIKKIAVTKVSNWLMENGYLKVKLNSNGNSYKFPTKEGNQIGIISEPKTGRGGQVYNATLYNLDAQKFLLDNIVDIIVFAEKKKI